jgi:hypothetical protein
MAKFYVSAEAVFTSVFIDTLEVPDNVVAQGKGAIRQWIKSQILESLRDDLEIDELSISFEKEEE